MSLDSGFATSSRPGMTTESYSTNLTVSANPAREVR